MATNHSVIRIDTACYGWIVTSHRTPEAAQAACIRRRNGTRRNDANVLAALIYTTAEVTGRKGERVRYA